MIDQRSVQYPQQLPLTNLITLDLPQTYLFKPTEVSTQA